MCRVLFNIIFLDVNVKGVKTIFFPNLYMSSVFLQVFDQEYLLVFFIFFVSVELQ